MNKYIKKTRIDFLEKGQKRKGLKKKEKTPPTKVRGVGGIIAEARGVCSLNGLWTIWQKKATVGARINVERGGGDESLRKRRWGGKENL